MKGLVARLPRQRFSVLASSARESRGPLDGRLLPRNFRISPRIMLITELAVATTDRVLYLLYVISTEEEPRALIRLNDEKNPTGMAHASLPGHHLRNKSIYSTFHDLFLTDRLFLTGHGQRTDTYWEGQKYIPIDPVHNRIKSKRGKFHCK